MESHHPDFVIVVKKTLAKCNTKSYRAIFIGLHVQMTEKNSWSITDRE